MVEKAIFLFANTYMNILNQVQDILETPGSILTLVCTKANNRSHDMRSKFTSSGLLNSLLLSPNCKHDHYSGTLVQFRHCAPLYLLKETNKCLQKVVKVNT